MKIVGDHDMIMKSCQYHIMICNVSNFRITRSWNTRAHMSVSTGIIVFVKIDSAVCQMDKAVLSSLCPLTPLKSNMSERSLTGLREPPFPPLNWTQEIPLPIASPLESTSPSPIPLSYSPTGESAASHDLMPTAHPLSGKTVDPTAPSSFALRSNVSPQEILGRPPFPRILNVNEADIRALQQVIQEAYEQGV